MVNEWLTGAEWAVDGSGWRARRTPGTHYHRLPPSSRGVDTPKLVKTGGLEGPRGTFSGALGGQSSVQLGRFQGWPVPLNGQTSDPLFVLFPC